MLRWSRCLAAALALTGVIARANDEKAAKTDVEPASADSDAPLPEGWPGSTKPGAIEVKSYPAYRSAIARGPGGSMKAQEQLFWPLFIHITRKQIAMTAPVIMTSEPRAGGPAESSMEFLYRRSDQGEVGPGGGTVKVEDRPAWTFVCLGIQGNMTETRRDEAVARLRTWLDEQKAEWVADGPPRTLGYHGPSTPEPKQLGEVQIPIKPAAGREPEKARDKPG